jgi:hypothetical protein
MICQPCIDHPQQARIGVGDTEVLLTGCAAHLFLTAEIYATGRRIQRTIAGYPKDPAYRCPRCRRTSSSAWDAIFGYCAHCKAYTG